MYLVFVDPLKTTDDSNAWFIYYSKRVTYEKHIMSYQFYFAL